MRGEDYSGGYRKGTSCIKERARGTLVPKANVASSSLCSSSASHLDNYGRTRSITEGEMLCELVRTVYTVCSVDVES